jgi:hypothetical protein
VEADSSLACQVAQEGIPELHPHGGISRTGYYSGSDGRSSVLSATGCESVHITVDDLKLTRYSLLVVYKV